MTTSETDQNALEAHQIRKRFGTRVVVKDVSLSIHQGEVVGLLGPNGAGKTTCFYMIAGLIKADQGSIHLGRRVITKEPMDARARLGLGYLPQEPSIFRKLSVRDNILAILETVTDLEPRERLSKTDALINEFKLEHVASALGMALSGGERRRAEIARALACEPKFLLLDEPLNGLDPVAQSAFRTLLSQLSERGICVVISSHTLSDLERLADEFVLMHQGRIVAEGPLSEIERDLGLKATLEIAGLGPTPTQFGDDIEVEEIDKQEGEEWAYRLHLQQGEWTTTRRSELGSDMTFTRLQDVPAGLETVISAATGIDVEDAGFTILSEVSADD